MVVEDEVGLDAGVGVVLQGAVADGSHPDRGGAGDVGAAQIADVERRLRLGVERLERRFEDLRRGLVMTDLVGEGPASEMVEQALRHEHLRIALRNYTATTVPTLNIDDYAQKIYQANRASGL